MEMCKNCGRLVDYVDFTFWCDDCSYSLELEIMKEDEDQ